jgi:hypothetical protein
MVEMDDLRKTWAEYDRKLDTNIRLSRQLLMATTLNRVRSPLRRLAFFLGLEVVGWGVIIVALGNFIYEHISMARFAVPAVALDLYSIGMLNSLIRQIALALQIDYGKPIATIQKQIEALRVLRIRTIQWGVLAGFVAWVPFMIVVFKAALGVDIYIVISKVTSGMDIYEAAWLWSNVAFGLALIPLAIWLSKKFGDRIGRFPMIQRFMKDLAGYNLNAAADFLATLSEFEEEKRDN